MNFYSDVIHDEIENHFNLNQLLRCLLMLAMSESKSFTFTEFEKYVGYGTPQPRIRAMLRFLEEKKLIEQSEKVYHVIKYKINRKELRNYIDDLASTELFYEYFNTFHYCYW